MKANIIYLVLVCDEVFIQTETPVVKTYVK